MSQVHSLAGVLALGQKHTEALAQEACAEDRKEATRRREQPDGADSREPPDLEDQGDSIAVLPDGERQFATDAFAEAPPGPPRIDRACRGRFRRLAVRFQITPELSVRPLGAYARAFTQPPEHGSNSSQVPQTLVPRGRLCELRRVMAEAIARHISRTVADASGRWPESLHWTDVPAIDGFDELLALTDDSVQQELRQRDKSQGVMLKSFALAFPDGSVVALDALLSCAGENRLATRAGALRAGSSVPRPLQLAGQEWTPTDWTKFDQAQKKEFDRAMKKELERAQKAQLARQAGKPALEAEDAK